MAEDLEWARDVLLAGHALVYAPAAVVVHSHERSARHELRRTRLVHARLAELFDLRLVPDVPCLAARGSLDRGRPRAAGGVAPAAGGGARAVARGRLAARRSPWARATRGRSRRSRGPADARADRRARLSARGRRRHGDLHPRPGPRVARRFADEILRPARARTTPRGRSTPSGASSATGSRSSGSTTATARAARSRTAIATRGSARIGAEVAAGWRPDVATCTTSRICPPTRARPGPPRRAGRLHAQRLLAHLPSRPALRPGRRALRGAVPGRAARGACPTRSPPGAPARWRPGGGGSRPGCPRRSPTRDAAPATAAAAALGAGAGQRASAVRLAVDAGALPHVSVFLAPVAARCASGTLTFGIPGDASSFRNRGSISRVWAGLRPRPETACASASSEA